MEGKVAVLGDSDFVLPFSALGLDTFATGEDGRQIEENAQKIVDAGYALVVIAENVARDAETVFSEFEKKAMPCLVVVPFTGKPSGYATESLSKVLRMATGIDIVEHN